MNRRSVLVSILLLPFATSAFGASKSDLVQQFHSKYSGLNSVACSFSSSFAKGTLIAKRGGKYKIEMEDRTIVCDGKQINNIQHSTKTVVIDTYNPNSEELSVERMFFVMLNVYRAEIVPLAKNSRIKLTPPDSRAMIAAVNEAVVHLNSSMLITRIDVAEGSAHTIWNISKLRLNQKISNTQFTYKAPKGWNVVDLR